MKHSYIYGKNQIVRYVNCESTVLLNANWHIKKNKKSKSYHAICCSRELRNSSFWRNGIRYSIYFFNVQWSKNAVKFTQKHFILTFLLMDTPFILSSTVMVSSYLNFILNQLWSLLKDKKVTLLFQLLWDEDDRCTMHICICHFLMNDLPKTVFEL